MMMRIAQLWDSTFGAAKLQLNMIKKVYFILCDFYPNKKKKH